MKALRQELNEAFRTFPGKPIIEGRIKEPLSTWRKMRRYHQSYQQIHDLIGLRIVVESVAQCYGALHLIRRLWPHGVCRTKDYIASPKPNGYQSLHLWLVLTNMPRIELQIRSVFMQWNCLYGSASHKQYKQQLEQNYHLTSPAQLSPPNSATT